MATLIESGSVPLSLTDVARISQTLAEDLQRQVFRTEGFTVEDYFSLDGNYRIEYVNGCLQVLPMPDLFHQAVIGWLYAFIKAHLALTDVNARCQFAPVRVMLSRVRYREPDVCVMLGKNASRRHRTHWDGCDLAIEVISPSNASHDWETKRAEYAIAGVPEYWIIDPDARTVTQLTLGPGETQYGHGQTFDVGASIRSRVVEGLAVAIDAMFAESESQAA